MPIVSSVLQMNCFTNFSFKDIILSSIQQRNQRIQLFLFRFVYLSFISSTIRILYKLNYSVVFQSFWACMLDPLYLLLMKSISYFINHSNICLRDFYLMHIFFKSFIFFFYNILSIWYIKISFIFICFIEKQTIVPL